LKDRYQLDNHEIYHKFNIKYPTLQYYFKTGDKNWSYRNYKSINKKWCQHSP
ncbi:MAG: hypothetical protein Satyrvirus25_16, partial [Satyrvirus sp.]